MSEKSKYQKSFDEKGRISITDPYVSWSWKPDHNPKHVTMDGEFTVEDLEEIARIMREYGS